MKMQEIAKIAQPMGINRGKHNKITLIRLIQRSEGSFDCFATALEGVCDQVQCLWREDCFEAAGKNQKSASRQAIAGGECGVPKV